MSLDEQWAWEAILASDSTDINVVAQFEAAPTGLAGKPKLRARAAVYWLRKATKVSRELNARVIDALATLHNLVCQHDSSGETLLDGQYGNPFLLRPSMELTLRVGVFSPSTSGC